MDCKEVKRMLSDYLANSLKSNYTDEIKEHLAKCQSCADSFKNLVEIDNMVKLTANEEPSEEYWKNYLSKFKNRLDKAQTPQSSENRNPFHIFTSQFALAFNGILIAFLILISGLLYKNTQQMKLLQTTLSEKQKETVYSVTTKEASLPIVLKQSSIDSTTKQVKLFQEIEDMFPKTIQWVVTSDGQIELGLGKQTLSEKTTINNVKPIFLKFNIMKLSETPEIVSSTSIMVLNDNEVNTKLKGLSEIDQTIYRYHCLPLLRADGKIDIRVRVSLDDTGLETDITAKEGDNIELGRLRKADTEYSIYVNVISKGLDIVKTEDKGI